MTRLRSAIVHCAKSVRPRRRSHHADADCASPMYSTAGPGCLRRRQGNRALAPQRVALVLRSFGRPPKDHNSPRWQFQGLSRVSSGRPWLDSVQGRKRLKTRNRGLKGESAETRSSPDSTRLYQIGEIAETPTNTGLQQTITYYIIYSYTGRQKSAYITL